MLSSQQKNFTVNVFMPTPADCMAHIQILQRYLKVAAQCNQCLLSNCDCGVKKFLYGRFVALKLRG